MAERAGPRTKRRATKWLIAAGLVALSAIGLWQWAVRSGSAATLDRVDALFTRERGVERAGALAYGRDPAQRVELWLPDGAVPVGGFPLLAFVHGGGWHSGAPADYRFVARAMGERGYATALIGYRLVPEGRYPAMLEDTAAGLRRALDLASQHDVATGSVALMGHSAGAYNVLMLGLEPRWLEAEGLTTDRIAGIVSLAGPADFFPFDKDSSRNAFGHAADPRATQPVTHVSPDAPPVLLMHGDADTVVRPRNSRVLAARLREAGAPVALAEYEGMSHAGIIMAFARPFDRDARVTARVMRFLEASAGARATVSAGSPRGPEATAR